jgi:hypothetical protein
MLKYNTNNFFEANLVIHSKALIARGIGYRTFTLKNPLLFEKKLSEAFVEDKRPVYTADAERVSEVDRTPSIEFNASRYVIVRAGHTKDLCAPLHKMIQCVTGKKERKLAVGSRNAVLAMNLLSKLHKYRAPSAYTGRGVRIKHEKPLRKAGKKDKQKGRAF